MLIGLPGGSVLRLQNTVLEMIARGEPFHATIDRLCLEVERYLPGVRASVLMIDRGNLVRSVAAPGFPAEIRSSLEGVLIGPCAGSCGSAAYTRTPVAVEDIEHDPKWTAFKALFRPIGVRASWSYPICDLAGAVVAVVAFYYGEMRGPTRRERRVMESCRRLFDIALERHARVLDRERRILVDALTGLANRAAFDLALAQLPNTDSGNWALFILDLDNLKVANDTFGHHAGDVLLQRVARRIADAMMPDVAFRLGGDEFAVLIQNPDSLRALDDTASRVLAAVAQPADCGGHIIVPQATIGGAVYDAAEGDADDVRQNADFALYHAKETGRGGYVRYWPGIGTRMTHRRMAIKDLAEALEDGRIDAYYQPVVRLDTREIIGLEALCRLRTRAGAIVTASALQDATCDVRVASALTRRMLSLVSVDMRGWLDEGLPIQKVGVNISTADLHAGNLVQEIAETFGYNRVPLGLLALEVNESVYVGRRDNVIARELEALRVHGMSVSLDDFGTGYASLTHLRMLAADNIKLDRSFIADFSTGDSSMAIVAGVLGIAERLGIRVVAEGIETVDQVEQLLAMGCTLGQGFLFSRAVDRDATAALLRRHAQGVPGAVPMPLDTDWASVGHSDPRARAA